MQSTTCQTVFSDDAPLSSFKPFPRRKHTGFGLQFAIVPYIPSADVQSVNHRNKPRAFHCNIARFTAQKLKTRNYHHYWHVQTHLDKHSNSWNKFTSGGKVCLLQHPSEDRYWSETKQKLQRKDSLGEGQWPGLWFFIIWSCFGLKIH